ncbi:hypothetical protein SARC_00293 [Sphaeroforma arctica JP610]|uniref:STAS domain-containing protein n=1 Tax=Sphaeroforma arctica JP610 TaxID=667725 RepID=A0A0L0GF37_9EUKA|nr:hypothetical protein SARC_00293 [Sphaeroforma arctica JP610]KNC87592.1 hypothetical protein SARC_00293 [Sphaeroforma arctica JP610]|eukprot:XP_014161494.1 hypothetical protein SARC_00293 [Sphaeroforma arctica JP610]
MASKRCPKNKAALHGSHVFTFRNSDAASSSEVGGSDQGENTRFIEFVEYDHAHYDGSYEAIKASYAFPKDKDGWKKAAQKKFPCTKWIPSYQWRSWIVVDLIAGITLSVMMLPQGVAFASLAGVPPQYGLYTCVFPPLVYAFLGTSRELSIGPFGLTSLMVGQGVAAALDGGVPGSDEFIAYAVTTTFVVGLYLFIAGLLKLGFITIYMSTPVIRSFTTGAAIGIATSQLSSLFQINTPNYDDPFANPQEWWYIVTHLGTTNAWSVGIGIVSMIFIYITKLLNEKYKTKMRNIPIPGELIVVVAAIILSYIAGLDEKGVAVIGDIPQGLPAPSLPPFGSVDIVKVAQLAMPVALVDYMVSVGVAKSLALRGQYKASSNQEFIALGATNIVGSFFGCIAASASLSRTSVVASIGAKSQLPSIVAALIVIVVLYCLTSVFFYLPKSVLAAIIIVGLRGMFKQHRDLITLWRSSKSEWLVWICTYLATILLGITVGLIVGVVLALLVVVYWISRPRVSQLGYHKQSGMYRDLHRTQCDTIDKCLVWRFSASLWYCNADHFQNRLIKQFNAMDGITDVVIDMNPVNNMDLQGGLTICTMHKYLEARKCRLLLAGCKGPTRDVLNKAGYFALIGNSQRVFSAVHDAVMYHNETEEYSRDNAIGAPLTVSQVLDMGENYGTHNYPSAANSNGSIHSAPLNEYDNGECDVGDAFVNIDLNKDELETVSLPIGKGKAAASGRRSSNMFSTNADTGDKFKSTDPNTTADDGESAFGLTLGGSQASTTIRSTHSTPYINSKAHDTAGRSLGSSDGSDSDRNAIVIPDDVIKRTKN